MPHTKAVQQVHAGGWCWVKPVALASHTGVPAQGSASPSPIWLPGDPRGKAAEDGPSALAPANHVRDLHSVSSSCLQTGPGLAVAAKWKINTCLSFPCHFVFTINSNVFFLKIQVWI